MTSDYRPSDSDKRSSGVTIGTVIGGIHDSIIAGRDVIVQTFTGSTEQQRAQRNRRAMLELVRNTWVKGVLEQSLHGAVMIELGLEEQANAVERPWDMELRTAGQPNRTPPLGTKIIDVFDKMNGVLLILGEPGSGKTTMLLELARDTIARAEKEPTQPIPVVFNLSSWAEKRQPIAEWLVGELNSKYHIPKRIARPWVEQDELLLLLDGLDEVKSEHRENCVKAINNFRQEYGMTPLVVCSRVAAYEVLTTRLKLQGAILLQPLTLRQVDKYLKGAGAELLAVRRSLQRDTKLQELAQSPLVLSIMTLAYKRMSVEDLGALDTTEARRRHIFDTYMQRMFERRGIDRRYSPEQTTRWLAWLAQNMSQYAHTVFLIEEMQPSWLPTGFWRQVYLFGSRLAFGLIEGLGVWLSVWLILWLLVASIFGLTYKMTDRPNFTLNGDPAIWPIIVMVLGLAFGLPSAWIVAVAVGLSVGITDMFWFKRSGENIAVKRVATRGQSVINALVVGLSVGLSIGLFTALIGGAFFGLISGLGVGLLFGPIFGLRSGKRSLASDVQAVEALSWSWRRALKGGALGLIAGLLAGLPVGLIFAVPAGPIAGLVFGLVLGLVGTVFGGLDRKFVGTKTTPNQGIWLSLRNAVLIGLSAGLIAGLLVALITGPIAVLTDGFAVGLTVGLISGIVGALSLGLLAALWYGGLEVIRHYCLRLILYCSGHTPWNYARFLDHAADCIFLRKVGGGYIFIHRLLMEYFASLEGEQTY